MAKKPAAGPSEALKKRMAAEKPAATSDQLATIRTLAEQALQAEQHKAALEAQLADISAAHQRIIFELLPDAMDAAGVSKLEVDMGPLKPKLEVKAQPFYKANIAADWPEERRREAFEYLDKRGDGAMIKTAVTIAFPSEKRTAALRFAEAARKKGHDPVVSEAIPWNTLTAWLKEQTERFNNNAEGAQPVDLEKIGGVVGRVAKLKELKT